jgi:hypothetical protein
MNFKKAYISHILVYNWLVRAPAHQELFLYIMVFAFGDLPPMQVSSATIS